MNCSHYNILIVDDDPTIGDCLKDIFSELGNYHTDIAYNPYDGIKKARNRSFDIVFSDILMPEMNGIEFLKQIKFMQPITPVVMITGFPTVETAINAMKEGAADFITKPFRMNHIKTIAEKIVRERKMLKENAQLQDAATHKKTIENLNKNLNAKVKEISILYSISESFSGSHIDDDLHSIYAKIVETAVEITGCSFSILMLVDQKKKELITNASYGLDTFTVAEQVQNICYKPLELLQIKKPFIQKNFPKNNKNEFDIHPDTVQLSSYVLLPLMIKEEIFALLFVANRENLRYFKQSDILLLQNLTRKASLTIENKLLYESIFENLKNTLHSLVAAIEARDKYTLTHSIKVTEYALNIAKALGCSQDELDILNSAGHLHDIGKIGVSDTILLKKGGLTTQEYEIIKQHPSIGENILKPLGFLPLERDIIRYHHERWDGTGYPDGLKKEEIPLLSRIIAVADSYDAMTTDRPYRKALGHEKAITELKNSTDQFDQAIVNVFIKIMTTR